MKKWKTSSKHIKNKKQTTANRREAEDNILCGRGLSVSYEPPIPSPMLTKKVVAAKMYYTTVGNSIVK